MGYRAGADFYRRLFSVLEDEKLTSGKKAAEKIGVSEGTLTNWKKLEMDAGQETVNMKVDTLVQICTKLNVSADYLLGFTEAKGLNSADLRCATDFTGLSEAAVQSIRHPLAAPFKARQIDYAVEGFYSLDDGHCTKAVMSNLLLNPNFMNALATIPDIKRERANAHRLVSSEDDLEREEAEVAQHAAEYLRFRVVDAVTKAIDELLM